MYAKIVTAYEVYSAIKKIALIDLTVTCPLQACTMVYDLGIGQLLHCKKKKEKKT